MNERLRKAINVRTMLRRKYGKINSSTKWECYRKQRNLAVRLHNESKASNMMDKCKSASSKGLWDAVKPLMSYKYSSGITDIQGLHLIWNIFSFLIFIRFPPPPP